MLNENNVHGNTIISQNIPTEQPNEDYTRVVAGQKEFLLGKMQTMVWRKIGENDQIMIEELHHLLQQQEGINISLNELCDMIIQFLRYGLVVERYELW